jgi:hypothetical protein
LRRFLRLAILVFNGFAGFGVCLLVRFVRFVGLIVPAVPAGGGFGALAAATVSAAAATAATLAGLVAFGLLFVGVLFVAGAGAFGIFVRFVGYFDGLGRRFRRLVPGRRLGGGMLLLARLVLSRTTSTTTAATTSATTMAAPAPAALVAFVEGARALAHGLGGVVYVDDGGFFFFGFAGAIFVCAILVGVAGFGR